MTARSSRREVRNPLLGLPEIAALQCLDPDVRIAIASLLRAIRADARVRPR